MKSLFFHNGKLFSVIANTADYLIIDKAPNIPFHQDQDQDQDQDQTQKNKQIGILDIVRTQETNKNEKQRLYPVHRLDKVTSGIIIFAKGRKNANMIGNLFRQRKVEKIYIALSDRKPKKKNGLVSGGMKRGRRGTWLLTKERENMAQTYFFSIPLLSSSVQKDHRPSLRLFVIKPITGRTHQIRVAMKSLGAPILGDNLYGRFDLARAEERTYLHAYGIRFSMGDGKKIQIICPPTIGMEFQSKTLQKKLASYRDIFDETRFQSFKKVF